MAFDLNIEFVGMCMFVPQPTVNPTVLHVLLLAPEQGPHTAGHPHATHYPRLFYAAAHSSSPGTTPYHSIALNDKLLDLKQFLGTTPLNTTLPNVPNVSVIAGRNVPARLIGSNPLTQLGARIELASGEGSEQTSGPWLMTGLPTSQVTFAVQWKIENVAGNALNWARLKELNGHGEQPLDPLTPLPDPNNPGRMQVSLRIVNVPFQEISAVPIQGNPPPTNTAAPHFAAHYTIFQNPAATPVPIYVGPSGPGGGQGTSFSCMPSQGNL